MGKPKKGGFPATQPVTHFVKIQGGEIDNLTLAWGDQVVWQNKDAYSHKLAGLGADGKPDPTKPWGQEITAVGSPGASSSPLSFQWLQTTPPPKDPQIFQYGCLEHPNEKAHVTAQLKV